LFRRKAIYTTTTTEYLRNEDTSGIERFRNKSLH